MFDRLMLLARGKIIYFNEARLSVNYFATGENPEVCPDLSNPADFFMTMMSIESIELDKETESQHGGGMAATKEQIEKEY